MDQSQRQFPANAANVLRTAQQMNMLLSQMADLKANMLLAATFVVFTIAVGQVGSMAEPLPLLVLGGGAFLSAVFAILAVLPATKYPASEKPNLLFFGQFTALEEADYVERMLDMLGSDESAYRAMARDLYQNGTVLRRRKYRYIAIAYRIFLAALVASLLTFIAEQLLI